MPISPAVSEDYSDMIYIYPALTENLPAELSQFFPQIVDSQFAILHIPLSKGLNTVAETGYASIPKLFTYVSTVSLEESGILSAQFQPVLNLTGNGILLGFLDSGIDYTHPAFRNPDGSTRILGIWDQTDQTGTPPDSFTYGTEYTEGQINQALFSANPYDLVPERDLNGHGTAVAGIACGTVQEESDFYGAAPRSGILFVRLKPAKQYLRDYFLIPERADAYQENDLMLGIRYLVQTARRLQKALVICITLGTNQGSHTGQSPLEEVIISAQKLSGIYAVSAAGNEAGKGHHFYKKFNYEGESTMVELLVDSETRGFTVELWADSPEIYNIGILSPGGEIIEPVPFRAKNSQEFTFLLENTKVTLDYEAVEITSGSFVALIRFSTPSTGLWRLQIVNRVFLNGLVHLWLPITGLSDPGIRFYSPSPDTTLVIPSCAEPVITVSAYNAYNHTLFINSSRGYTRNGIIKPDFAAPGVNVTAPSVSSVSGLAPFTGSSAASAITAGAACLLIEWGLHRSEPRIFSSTELKSLFLFGTVRNPALYYPNREWGYGTMNVYQIFESMIRP
ncbi:MAG: S8 family peptidase [Lachnospiraceae bacterium]|nr:S8 family peptidase [Lachnospiraceae bacterium]